jgi:hypothetical protein
MNLQNYGFGHPPTTSFWFIPLAKVGYPVMSEIVAVVTLLALLFHLIICAKELQLPAKLAFVLVGMGLAMQSTWLWDHIVLVQVSEIIAFLITLAWYFLRRDRELEAGVTLGAACTFKLFPGLLVFFLLITRRFRGVAAAVVTYAAIALYMTSGYGIQAWKDFFHQQGPIAHYWVGHMRNASLHGVVARLFRPMCARPPDDQQVLDIIGALRKLPSVPPLPGARWAMVASVLVIAFAWWITRRAAARTRAIDVPYALFSTVAVFVNPWSWEHYAVLIITPLAVLIAAVVRRAKEVRILVTDPERPPRSLVRTTAELATVLAAAAAIIALLWVSGYTKMNLYGQYWSLRDANEPLPAGLHARMHFYEALNWLPWVVAIAGLSGLSFFERRRDASHSAAGVTVQMAATSPDHEPG